MQTGLSPTSMTKVRNSYPEDIACVFRFPRVFQATEEYFHGRSQDYLWKLQVDLTRNDCIQSALISTIIDFPCEFN